MKFHSVWELRKQTQPKLDQAQQRHWSGAAGAVGSDAQYMAAAGQLPALSIHPIRAKPAHFDGDASVQSEILLVLSMLNSTRNAGFISLLITAGSVARSRI